MKEKQILERARERAAADFIPVCGEGCARILEECCLRLKPRRILEIGTAVGCSAALMALSCGAEVDTIDFDEERLKRAQELWRELGLEGRIHAFCGDVKRILPEVIAGKKYGLVFIDGPKSAYKSIFERVREHTEKGGEIVSDDVDYLGLVLSKAYPPHKHRTIVTNMRDYLEYISAPPLDTRVFGDCGVAVTEVR